MARVLIVGCGCSGELLAVQVGKLGHAVKATTRDPDRVMRLEEAGNDAVQADPAKPIELMEHIRDVSVVVWLLGSASGEKEQIQKLHGAYLERLLEKLVDTHVRGFVYQSEGTVDDQLLSQGWEIVQHAGRTWNIPVAEIAEQSEPYLDWAQRCCETINAMFS